MRKTILLNVLAGWLVLAPHLLLAQNPGENIPDRYIVELKAGVAPQAVAAAHGIAADGIFTAAVNAFAGTLPPARLKALQRDGRVVAVTPDRVVTANPKGGNGGGKPDKPGGGGDGDDGGGGDPPARDPEVIPAGVERIGAIPGEIPASGDEIGIAIVDTGLDFAHPDLTTGSTSFKAVLKGRSMTTSEGPTAGQDDEGHGTHVGGISAAKFDGFEVVGVAPDATLYAVKVLNNRGRGSDSTVIAGLNWIAANADSVFPPIKVANLSLGREGSLGDNPTYHSAIQSLTALGITVVVAAGNDSSLEVSQQVPAAYPEVIAVASSTAQAGDSDIAFVVGADTASFFTTDGAGVTISAPGAKQEDIANGYVNSVGILSTQLGGGTVRESGTSMAAPHVAGVAALLYQYLGSTDPETVRSRITNGASNVGSAPHDSPTTGYSFDGVREGILDAAGALTP